MYKERNIYNIKIAVFVAFFSSFLVIKANAESTFFEKVFLHTDNNIYTSGDSIFFKAYIVDATTNKKSTVSKVLYIELIDAFGKKLLSRRANIYDGMVICSMYLPDTLRNGVYVINSYTKASIQAGYGFVFSKRIMIINLSNELSNKFILPAGINSKNKNKDYTIIGDLINGIPCTIGVKRNFLFNFSIENEKDSTIASSISDSMGIGVIRFIPHEGEKYYLVIVSNEEKIKKELPQVKTEGYVIDYDFDSERITVYNKCSSLRQSSKVLVYSKNKFLKQFTFNKPTLEIETDEIPVNEGIICVSVYDEKNHMVAQRLIFKANKNKNEICSIAVNEHSESGLVDVNISKSDKIDTLNLSISISACNPIGKVLSEHNFYNYVVFYSEISNGCFLPLVDHKISVFEANRILSTIQPDLYLYNNKVDICNTIIESNGFVFTGKIGNQSNNPIENIPILLSFNDTLPVINYSLTTKNGNFFFLLDNFYDNKTIKFQVYKYNSFLNDYFFNELDTITSIGYSVPLPYVLTDNESYFIKNYIDIQLINKIYRPIAEKDRKNDKINKKIRQLQNFNFNPEYTVYPDDYTDLINFQEIIENILPGVSINKASDKRNIYIYNSKLKEKGQFPATIFINGIPCFSVEEILNIPKEKIYKIDVTKDFIMFGDINFYGIISIITKEDLNLNGNVSIIYNNDVIANSKSEKYSFEDLKLISSNRFPDLRYLYYYNYNLILYGNNLATINAKCSLLKYKPIVIVEGISSNGDIISIRK